MGPTAKEERATLNVLTSLHQHSHLGMQPLRLWLRVYSSLGGGIGSCWQRRLFQLLFPGFYGSLLFGRWPRKRATQGQDSQHRRQASSLHWSHPIPGGKSGGVWPPFGVRQSGRGLQLSGRGDGRGEITEGVLEPPRRRNPRAAAGGECLPAGSVVCGCSGVGGCVERRVFWGRLRAQGDCTRCGGDHESA